MFLTYGFLFGHSFFYARSMSLFLFFWSYKMFAFAPHNILKASLGRSVGILECFRRVAAIDEVVVVAEENFYNANFSSLIIVVILHFPSHAVAAARCRLSHE